MKLEEINYSSLENFTPWKHILNAYAAVFKSLGLYVGLCIVLFACLCNYFLISSGAVDEKSNYIGLLFGIGVFLFNAFVVDLYTRLRKEYWSEFALTNGWKKVLFKRSFVPPSIQHIGIRARNYDFPIQAHKWTITPHRYETSSGKYSQTVITTIFSVELPKALPYIAIDSVKNMGGLVDVPDGFDVVELEGDVRKHFVVSVQKGLYTDALSILSPDILAVLIDYCKDYDVEIMDNMLYILAVGDHRTSKHMKKMFTACEALRSELYHRCASLNYVAGKDFDYRGEKRSAITKASARYKRSLILEFKRAHLIWKFIALLLFVVFLVLAIVLF